MLKGCEYLWSRALSLSLLPPPPSLPHRATAFWGEQTCIDRTKDMERNREKSLHLIAIWNNECTLQVSSISAPITQTWAFSKEDWVGVVERDRERLYDVLVYRNTWVNPIYVQNNTVPTLTCNMTTTYFPWPRSRHRCLWRTAFVVVFLTPPLGIFSVVVRTLAHTQISRVFSLIW